MGINKISIVFFFTGRWIFLDREAIYPNAAINLFSPFRIYNPEMVIVRSSMPKI